MVMVMDDYLLESCSRALVTLARDGVGLDELLEPRQPPSGENAGKPPSRQGPRPPVSVVMLDLKAETERLLGRWCHVVATRVPDAGSAPSAPSAGGRLIVARCEWLRAQLPAIAVMAWGQMCAEELVAQARLVADVVMPPTSSSSPQPLEVGTARLISRWCANLGYPISRTAIRRLIAAGALPSQTLPDGRVVVRLLDVLPIAQKGL